MHDVQIRAHEIHAKTPAEHRQGTGNTIVRAPSRMHLTRCAWLRRRCRRSARSNASDVCCKRAFGRHWCRRRRRATTRAAETSAAHLRGCITMTHSWRRVASAAPWRRHRRTGAPATVYRSRRTKNRVFPTLAAVHRHLERAAAHMTSIASVHRAVGTNHYRDAVAATDGDLITDDMTAVSAGLHLHLLLRM